MLVNVAGGTGAGKRRPLQAPPAGWRCGCGHANKGFHARCMQAGCNQKRPKQEG